MDIGRPTLTGVKLVDNIPVKEANRRILSGMYEEVRQHIKEILDIGVIRKSSSPYCSNVALVRKKDASF